MNKTPIFKDIILVGGGHAHALLIKQWGMKPVPGVRLTLISPQALTPYSGMLPGLIAEHYSFEEVHIDLPKLCQWGNVRFVQGAVNNIKPEQKTLQLNKHPSLHYDLLSLDIGSTPNHSVTGVSEHASPIKPIAGFYAQWESIKESLRNSQKSKTIVVVGGGAGSVETILAMAWAVKNDAAIKATIQFKLVFRASSILSAYSKNVIKKAEQVCADKGILLQGDFDVSSVDTARLNSKQGDTGFFDHLFWCTQASAPSWLAETGLSCNEEGFLEVNEYLQSLNYEDIFAAGDIAHMVKTPRPKAGVYAVRQAPFLFENICSQLFTRSLKVYKPQDNFLSLLSLGNKSALAVRSPLPIFSGDWVWRWKDRIDQKFMEIFTSLPPVMAGGVESAINPVLIPESEQQEVLHSEQRCGGCGAKIGSGVLAEVLTELTGAYEPEDACTLQWSASTLLQSIDHLTAPFDEPYLFGRIAVFHALSDLFAMNAQAHSIQVAVTLPFAGRAVQTRELRLLLQGVLSACEELKLELLGGHSSEGTDLSVAISVNGYPGETGFTKGGLDSGNLLVLSKSLGTGIILAGQMSQQTQGKDLLAAIDSMNQSNQAAAAVLNKLKVKSCTDVTGFGLLGHLSEMLVDPNLQIEIIPENLPCLSGALDLAKAGIRSSLFPQNELNIINDKRWHNLRDSIYWPLLLDPQTSGGLLAGIAPEHEAAAKAAGFTVIGKVI